MDSPHPLDQWSVLEVLKVLPYFVPLNNSPVVGRLVADGRLYFYAHTDAIADLKRLQPAE